MGLTSGIQFKNVSSNPTVRDTPKGNEILVKETSACACLLKHYSPPSRSGSNLCDLSLMDKENVEYIYNEILLSREQQA